MPRSISAAVCIAAITAATPVLAETRTDVTVASPWEIASYDPTVSGSIVMALEIMETLVDADEAGTLRPGLATDWTVSDDGLTWVFTLRDGVSFHDGSAFDAQAAVFALTRAWEQPGILQKSPINGIFEQDGEVVITLETPFTALPSLLTHSTTIIPAPAAFDDKGNPSALIGTGPFKVTKFMPPQSVAMARFDDYWGEKAKLETATYLAASRAETRALLAESGDADLVFTFDASGYSHLQHVDTITTTAVPIPRAVLMKVNASHPFFEDVRAREALSLATPRAGIAKSITRFPESAATQLFPPALSDWHSADLEPLATDMDAASALLAELGWTPGDDGILTRDGERFEIQLRTFPDRPELPLIATALQDTWRTIGIDLDVSVASYSEIPKGHQDGSLEVGLFARNYGLTPDPIGPVTEDFGAEGGDWGAMGWTNLPVAEAIQVVASTDDPQARAAGIATVTQALHRELPVIPVVWYEHTVSVANGLEGVIIDPLQRSYGLSEMFWAE